MPARLIRTSVLALLILTGYPPSTRAADVAAPAKLLDLAKMSAFQSKKFDEAVESECNALLKDGVFNSLRIRSSSDIRTAIEEWECKHEFKTHDEALASGLSVGFPVGARAARRTSTSVASSAPGIRPARAPAPSPMEGSSIASNGTARPERAVGRITASRARATTPTTS